MLRLISVVVGLSMLLILAYPSSAARIAQASLTPEVGGLSPDVGGTVTVTPGGVAQPQDQVPAQESAGQARPVEPTAPPAQPEEARPPIVVEPQIQDRTVPRIETQPSSTPATPALESPTDTLGGTTTSTPAGEGAGPGDLGEADTAGDVSEFDEEVDVTEEPAAIPNAGVGLAWLSISGGAIIVLGLVIRRAKR